MTMPISEFSFGYAFTENLIRSSQNGPATAPKFPSLIEEAGVGYDVKIELPAQALFFQFKVGRLLRRSTAKEISRGTIPGLTVPYFRFPVTRRDWSDQHKRLVELENKFPDAVFYAAPLTLSESEFHDAYAQTSVHTRSALFSPRDIGLLPDDLQHNIVFKPGLRTAWFCSEPSTIKTSDIQGLSSRIANRLSGSELPPLREAAATIKESILDALPERFRSEATRLEDRFNNQFSITPTDDGSTAIELAVAQELSRVALGVEFVIAQPRS